LVNFLTLTLLVTSVGADDADDALALDYLALGTDGLDGGAYLHNGSFEGRVVYHSPVVLDNQ